MKLQNYIIAGLILIWICLLIPRSVYSQKEHYITSIDSIDYAVIPIDYVHVYNYLYDLHTDKIHLQGLIIERQSVIIELQGSGCNELKLIIDSKDRIIINKDKEIELLRKKKPIRWIVSAFLLGVGLGVLI